VKLKFFLKKDNKKLKSTFKTRDRGYETKNDFIKGKSKKQNVQMIVVFIIFKFTQLLCDL
jgi:hypothetical protein